jgi:hypothetical protein
MSRTALLSDEMWARIEPLLPDRERSDQIAYRTSRGSRDGRPPRFDAELYSPSAEADPQTEPRRAQDAGTLHPAVRRIRQETP